MKTSATGLILLIVGAVLTASPACGATFQLVGSDPLPVDITGPLFSFQANGVGGGIFDFKNQTGLTLTELHFVADVPNPGCSGGTPTSFNIIIDLPFSGLIIDSSGSSIGCPNSHFDLVIKNISLLNLDVFQVTLNDNPATGDNGPGGWGSASNPVTFRAGINGADPEAVPEPASVGLIAVGLSGLLLRRVRLQQLLKRR